MDKALKICDTILKQQKNHGCRDLCTKLKATSDLEQRVAIARKIVRLCAPTAYSPLWKRLAGLAFLSSAATVPHPIDIFGQHHVQMMSDKPPLAYTPKLQPLLPSPLQHSMGPLELSRVALPHRLPSKITKYFKPKNVKLNSGLGRQLFKQQVLPVLKQHLVKNPKTSYLQLPAHMHNIDITSLLHQRPIHGMSFKIPVSGGRCDGVAIQPLQTCIINVMSEEALEKYTHETAGSLATFIKEVALLAWITAQRPGTTELNTFTMGNHWAVIDTGESYNIFSELFSDPDDFPDGSRARLQTSNIHMTLEKKFPWDDEYKLSSDKPASVSLVMHELAHLMLDVMQKNKDPFATKVAQMYEKYKNVLEYQHTVGNIEYGSSPYMSTKVHEFFAVGVETWFNTVVPNAGRSFRNKAEMYNKLPEFAELLSTRFVPWTYNQGELDRYAYEWTPTVLSLSPPSRGPRSTDKKTINSSK